MKMCPVDQAAALMLVLRAEEDGGRKDALKAWHHASVVAAILGEAEKLEHLAGALEMNCTTVLTQGERRHPNRDKALLAEGRPTSG
jgi:hypothetical protein